LTIGGSLLFFIPGVLLSAVMYLALTDYIVSGRKGMRAIAAAMTLLRNKFRLTLGHFALVGVLMFVFLFVVGIILAIVSATVKIQLLANVLIAPLSGFLTVVVLIYVYTWYRGCVDAKKVELGGDLETAIEATLTRQKKWYYFSFLSVLIVPVVIGIISSAILVSLNTARMKGLEAQRRNEMKVREYQRQIQMDMLQNQPTEADERIPVESLDEVFSADTKHTTRSVLKRNLGTLFVCLVFKVVDDRRHKSYFANSTHVSLVWV
ncbi:MAG: hypothetical protein ACKOW9_01900, partial [Candidatus Paceibacterota bacterium]